MEVGLAFVVLKLHEIQPVPDIQYGYCIETPKSHTLQDICIFIIANRIHIVTRAYAYIQHAKL
jgi:hypothetical protein